MAHCNACTPQAQNLPGNNCRNVDHQFTVQGRGMAFQHLPITTVRHFHVPYLKFGALHNGYHVSYLPDEDNMWKCNCPDFIYNLASSSCCKHIILCIDRVNPGAPESEYPSDDYLDLHVHPASVNDLGEFHCHTCETSTYHQLVLGNGFNVDLI